MPLWYYQNYRATGKPHTHIKAPSPSFVIGKPIAIFLPSQPARDYQRRQNKYLSSKGGILLVRLYNKGIPVHVSRTNLSTIRVN